MPETCKEKDVTLAIGASVPTTNDVPVTVFEEEEVDIEPLPQPEMIAAVMARIEGSRIRVCSLECISGTSLSAVVRGLHGSIAGIDYGTGGGRCMRHHEPSDSTNPRDGGIVVEGYVIFCRAALTSISLREYEYLRFKKIADNVNAQLWRGVYK